MPSRRGAGGVLLIAFALALLVILTVELIQVNPVSADEEFHAAFRDLRDYVAGVIAASQALPPEEVVNYVNSSLKTYEEEMAERGLVFTFYYDSGDGMIWYYLMHGDNYAVGAVPLAARETGGSGEGGSGGSGGGGEGGPAHLPVEFSVHNLSLEVPKGCKFRLTRAVFIKSYLNESALVRVEGGEEVIGMKIVVLKPHEVLKVKGNVAEFQLDAGARAVVTFFVFSTESLGDYSYLYVYSINPDLSDQKDVLVIEWRR